MPNENILGIIAIIIAFISLVVSAYFAWQANLYSYKNLIQQGPDVLINSYSCPITPTVLTEPDGPFIYYSSITFSNIGLAPAKINLLIKQTNSSVNLINNLSYGIGAGKDAIFPISINSKVGTHKSFGFSILANTSNSCYKISCSYNISWVFAQGYVPTLSTQIPIGTC